MGIPNVWEVLTCGVTILGGVVALVRSAVLCGLVVGGRLAAVLLLTVAVALGRLRDLLSGRLLHWRLFGLGRGDLLGYDVPGSVNVLMLFATSCFSYNLKSTW